MWALIFNILWFDFLRLKFKILMLVSLVFGFIYSYHDYNKNSNNKVLAPKLLGWMCVFVRLTRVYPMYFSPPFYPIQNHIFCHLLNLYIHFYYFYQCNFRPFLTSFHSYRLESNHISSLMHEWILCTWPYYVKWLSHIFSSIGGVPIFKKFLHSTYYLSLYFQSSILVNFISAHFMNMFLNSPTFSAKKHS